MSPEKEKIPIKFRFAKINVISHSLSIPEEFDLEKHGDDIDINLGMAHKVFHKESLYEVMIGYKIYWSKKDKEKKLLSSIDVSTVFQIENLDEFIKMNTIKNNDVDEVWSELLTQLAIGHTRGIQSIYSKGTKIEEVYLPYIDRILLSSTLGK